jgi:hypothetical protein
MKRFVPSAVAFLILTNAHVLADDGVPENIAAYLAQRDEQAAAEVKRLESEILRLSKDKSKSSREIVAKWRKAHDALKKSGSEFEPQIPYQFCVLRASEIGTLARNELGERGGRPGVTLIVSQIIDEENMLVDATWIYDDFVGGPSRSDLRTVRKKIEHRVWLRGFPTAKLANGSAATIEGLVEVTGNKTYETVLGGSDTVFVIEPFDRDKLKPYLDEKKPPKKMAGKTR